MLTYESCVVTPDESGVYEIRRFASKKQGVPDKEFKFLVIDQISKWAAAHEIKTTFSMKLNDTQTLRFPMQGISLKDWETVEISNHIPSEIEGASEEAKSEIEEMSRKAICAKRIALFELATGKTIPGNTIDEKNDFLSARVAGELESLYSFVTYTLAGISRGQLVNEYLQCILNSENSAVIEFAGFDDWKVATETRAAFRMHRSYEDFIVEFPVIGISDAARTKIDNECKDPAVPQIPKRKPGGGFERGQVTANYNDPSWRAASRAVNQKRITKYLTACLPFIVPGLNEREQYDWLSQRNVGDIIGLKGFIEENLLSFGDRFNFTMSD